MQKQAGSLTARALPETMRERWYNSDHFDPDDKWSGFAPKSAAVVLVDMINWQAHPDGANIRALIQGGGGEGAKHILERCETVVMPALHSVLEVARAAGTKVIHARLASRSANYDDIVPSMQPYLRAAEATEGSLSSAQTPRLTPTSRK
jgi:nicotinamidase-related amidase